MTEPRPDDAIERMLTAAAPRTSTVTPEIEDELARMSVRARTDHAPAGRRGLGAKLAAGAVVAALAVGGAGVAAAATGGWGSWWADEPDGVARYTLPSGAHCEHRIGGLMIGTKYEHIREFAREWYATSDLDAIVEDGVQERIAAQRADRDRWFVADDGTRTPAWFGTEAYKTPDQEYADAAQSAITDALDDALHASGLDLEIAPGGRGLQIPGEISCPGAQW